MIRFIFILSVALAFISCVRRGPDTPDFYSEIRSVDKLILSETRVTKMATVRDPDFTDAETLGDRAAAVISSLKVGQRVAVYSYDTYIQSYIDLSSLTPADVVVNDHDRTVTLYLPPICTELAGRDGTLREEHYRVTGFRSDIGPQERARLKERMNSELLHEIESGTIAEASRESARAKAFEYFATLISASGYRPIISIKDSSSRPLNENETGL